MRLLLLIVFIMGFVVFAEPTQHVGGLMHGDGSYIPDSALVWADVARKTMRFSDVVGYHVLQYWYSQIEAFNRDIEHTVNPTTAILKFFQVSNDLIGRLRVHIKGNLVLAHRYAITYTRLKKLLEKIQNEEATVMDVNNYLIDAYPKFISAINSNK